MNINKVFAVYPEKKPGVQLFFKIVERPVDDELLPRMLDEKDQLVGRVTISDLGRFDRHQIYPLFHQKSLSVAIILGNSLYQLLALTLMGAIIGAWR